MEDTLINEVHTNTGGESMDELLKDSVIKPLALLTLARSQPEGKFLFRRDGSVVTSRYACYGNLGFAWYTKRGQLHYTCVPLTGGYTTKLWWTAPPMYLVFADRIAAVRKQRNLRLRSSYAPGLAIRKLAGNPTAQVTLRVRWMGDHDPRVWVEHGSLAFKLTKKLERKVFASTPAERLTIAKKFAEERQGQASFGDLQEMFDELEGE